MQLVVHVTPLFTQDSVSNFATWVEREELSPRILINNAGAMVPELQTLLLTNVSGVSTEVEASFATNTVGPAALVSI